MAQKLPQKVTFQIEQTLLVNLKVYSVTHHMPSFSTTVNAALRPILFDSDRPTDLKAFTQKYQHAGISSLCTPGRGRPSAEFNRSHGPILRKKATFRLPPSTIAEIRRYAVNRLFLDRSSFVNMAIKIFLEQNKY